MSWAGRRRSWLGVALLLSGTASGAATQGRSNQKPPPPVFGAEVALVAVPVFVTDKSGKAVPGLMAEDFEVYDGGRRVPIVAFQAIDVGHPAAPPGSALPAAVQAAASRQFLLLFDLQFSPPAGVIRARAAATRFVQESLAAGDLVAVATFGRGGLKMLTGFTTDRAYVARAIAGLGMVGAIEPASDPLGLGAELAAPAGGAGVDLDREIAEEVDLLRQALKRQYQQRVIDFLASVEDLAQALSSLRGRKQIVLLSGGVVQEAWTDSSAEAGPSEAFDQTRQDQLTASLLRHHMYEMFRRAGLSDVVIHSVNLRGLEGPVDVSSRTGRNAGRGEGGLALAALAQNTGGRFILPTNDLGRALREVDDVSRHYYVLAFQPAEPGPKGGRPRGVRVRVHRDGIRVSHRAAYVVPKTPPAADAAAVRLAAAEAIAKGLSGGALGLQLVAVPYRDGEGRASLPAVLHVEGPALAAAAAQGDRLGVQVYGYALAAGRVLDSFVFDTTLDLSKVGAAVRSDGLRVVTAFAVSPGVVDLRFFVRAGSPGEVGSIRRQVEVPAFAEGESVLSAPMPTLPATGRIVAPLETQGRPRLEIPFRVGGEPFLPDASPALKPGLSRDLCVFVWRSRSASAQPLEVTGEITRPGEPPRPLHIDGTPRIVPDTDGFDRYLVSVVPPQAPPGDYSLRLTFREPGTGLTTRRETGIALQD